ncbi:MAG: hypothetical protein IKZ47_00720, partial [Clostridia bacterium]|nr:hypothetical protein [Clostridia bacterium]
AAVILDVLPMNIAVSVSVVPVADAVIGNTAVTSVNAANMVNTITADNIADNALFDLLKDFLKNITNHPFFKLN